MLETIAPVVNGRTADEVIQLEDAERARVTERARRLLESHLTNARQALAEARVNNRTLPVPERDQEILNQVQISGVNLVQRRVSESETLMLIFSVRNSSTIPISRVFLTAALQTPGQQGAKINELFSYRFPGALAAGLEQRVITPATMLAEWDQIPEDERSTLRLQLLPVAIEDIRGRRTGAPDGKQIL